MGALVSSAGRLVEKVLPAAVPRLKLIKHRISQWRKTWMHASDARKNYRHMEWRVRRDLAVVEAELIFHYHKIEKGLCMPPPRRFFGVEPAKKTVELIYEWEARGGALDAPSYLGAIEAMRAYAQSLAACPPPADVACWMVPMLERFLHAHHAVARELSTPVKAAPTMEHSAAVMNSLMHARRSVRHYKDEPVPVDLIERCVAVAQLSPSACNRQPWRVHLYKNSDQIKKLLNLQNGNSGFGHQIKSLLIISSDRRSFFDASERNEPYVDGGLFSMSLILALQSEGVASCCLNWCVDEERDSEAHRLGGIDDSEAIIMYLAVGYADEAAIVPRSARKPPSSVLCRH